MGVLLGASGSIRATFEQARNQKKRVQLSLVNGKDAAGLVVGVPTDDYVVLRPDPASTSDAFDVLIRTQAIATISLVPEG